MLSLKHGVNLLIHLLPAVGSGGKRTIVRVTTIMSLNSLWTFTAVLCTVCGSLKPPDRYRDRGPLLA